MRFQGRAFKVFLRLAILAAVLASATAVAGPILDNIEKTVVYNYEGTASMIRNGKTELLDLDMRTLKGDVYVTGPGESSIDISVPALIGARVLADSEMQVVTIQKTAMVFKLVRGGMMIKTEEKLPDGLEIRIDTPTTTATVRGTQFMARTSGAGEQSSAFYAVRKGKVEVFIKESNATVAVTDGFALEIPPDAYIPTVRNQTDEEIKQLKVANQVPIMLPDPV